MSGILPEMHQCLSGAASATDTSTMTVIAAPDTGRLCVTSLQLGRNDAGTTAITVTLNDAKATVLVVPNSGGGGSVPVVFDTPLILPAKTALTAKASSGVTTLFVSAQGFLAE